MDRGKRHKDTKEEGYKKERERSRERQRERESRCQREREREKQRERDRETERYRERERDFYLMGGPQVRRMVWVVTPSPRRFIGTSSGFTRTVMRCDSFPRLPSTVRAATAIEY